MTPFDPAAPPREPWLRRNLPWVMLGVAGVYLLSVFGRMNPPRQPYDLDAFARIPVVEGGRVKPLETVARVDLRVISGREEFVDEKGDKQPAIKWYLEAMAGGTEERRGPAFKYKVFRIDNEQLLTELDLKPQEGLRYSLEQIAPKIDLLQDRATKADRKRKQGKQLDQFENKVVELANRIQTFITISRFGGALLMPPQSAGDKWEGLADFRDRCRQEAAMTVRTKYNFTPESVKNMSEDQLRNLSAEMEKEFRERVEKNPVAAAWERMVEAYRDKKPDEFNRRLAEYRETFLHHVSAGEMSKLGIEVTYNRFAPFYHCVGLYVLAFVLCAVSWLGNWTDQLRKSAFYLIYLTLAIHTAALIIRMYVQGRPPVTNLYSSAVFIGWGCVVLGLILERLYPIGVGNLLASVLGLSTTIVSHNLGTGGDTMEMMQAVLDTNFWLSTHVTTVTLGYTATFVAGFIGAAYVARMLAAVVRDSFKQPGTPATVDLLVFGAAAAGLVSIPVMLLVFVLNALGDFEIINGTLAQILEFLVVAGGAIYAVALLFSRATSEGVDAHGVPRAGELPAFAHVLDRLALDADSGKKLSQMCYGIICFATLLSFVGTVLGGIWADQSWGRFWGWDPKENGAVLIVLWNALILHARWGGMAKARGIAVLAVFGNIICAWSWFGTNQLGIGLHAYGFDTRLAAGCRWFWISQLVIIGLGTIPQRYWSAAANRRPAAEPVKSNPEPAPAASPAVTAPAPAPAPVAAPAANGQNGHPAPGKGKKHRGKRR